MIYPKFDEVKAKAKGCNIVPIALETLADLETPVSVFKRFKDDSPFCFLLDSVEGGEKWARYSFIGHNPLLTLKIKDNSAKIKYRDGKEKQLTGNPYEIVQNVMADYKSAHIEGIPRLTGGAVGFFGYDLVRSVEYLPNAPHDDLELPECHFMIVDEMVVFDHLKQKLILIVNMPTKGDLQANYDNATKRLLEIQKIIHTDYPISKPNTKINHASEPQSNMSKEHFCKMVEKAKEYIVGGDIFQVVLSQRFSIETMQDPFDVYRQLRTLNPSPYMFYLKFDDYCIVGASPEMLMRCEDGIVETCPIAGTRHRGATREEDAELEKELLADEKEIAEHTMLVDLGRNDIGKVSEFGSVKLTDYMKVLKFSHVMHIVTTVQGKLREGLNAFDALMAVLPAGTLSGAPKIRAMEIIDELEPTRRGIYGGAIGYISFSGNIDCCITIRTILFKDGKAYIQTGAGIVADSVPEKEFEETQNKAGALFKALKEAGEMK